MAFPIDEAELVKTETRLGIRFPEAFRRKMMADNGGEVGAGDDVWFLYPFLDTSDKKRLKRTCNDITRETQVAKGWTGFPDNAVAMGANGSGDKLVFMLDSANPSLVAPGVYWWHHETGSLQKLAEDFAELIES